MVVIVLKLTIFTSSSTSAMIYVVVNNMEALQRNVTLSCFSETYLPRKLFYYL